MPILIPQSRQRLMRWKDGGGVTREIMRFPQDSSLESFDWRISVATVQQGGAFSIFPGIDRSLAILAGQGMTLDITDTSCTLTPASPILRFDGETPVRAALLDGDIVDFNVMTRRGRYRHQLERMTLSRGTDIRRQGEITLIYLASGSCGWSDAGGALRLNAGDALLLEEHEHGCKLETQAAELMLTHIYRQS